MKPAKTKRPSQSRASPVALAKLCKMGTNSAEIYKFKKPKLILSQEMKSKLVNKLALYQAQGGSNEVWSDRMSQIAAPLGAELFLNNESIATVLGAPRFYFKDFKGKSVYSVPDGVTRFPYSDFAHVAAKRIQRLFIKYMFLRNYCAALIQRRYRLYMIRRDYKRLLDRFKRAAGKIQRFYRRRAVRYRIRKAAFMLKIRSAVIIQSIARRVIARRKLPQLREQYKLRMYSKLYFWLRRCLRRRRKARGVRRRQNNHAIRIQRVIRGVLCRADLRVFRSAQIAIAWAFRRFWKKKFRRYATRFVGALRKFVLRRKILRIQTTIRKFLAKRRVERYRIQLLASNAMRCTKEQLVLAQEIGKFAAESIDWLGEQDIPNLFREMSQIDLLARQIIHRMISPMEQKPNATEGNKNSSNINGNNTASNNIENNNIPSPQSLRLSRTQIYVFAVLSAFANRQNGMIDCIALQAAGKYLIPVKWKVKPKQSRDVNKVQTQYSDFTDLDLAKEIVSSVISAENDRLEQKKKRLHESQSSYAARLGIKVEQLSSQAHANMIYSPDRSKGKTTQFNEDDNTQVIVDADAGPQTVAVAAPSLLQSLGLNYVLNSMAPVVKPFVKPLVACSTSLLRKLKLGHVDDVDIRKPDEDEIVASTPLLKTTIDFDALYEKLAAASPSNTSLNASINAFDMTGGSATIDAMLGGASTFGGTTQGLEKLAQTTKASSVGKKRVQQKRSDIPDLPHVRSHASKFSKPDPNKSILLANSDDFKDPTSPEYYWNKLLQTKRIFSVADLVICDIFKPASQKAFLSSMILGSLPKELLLDAVVMRRWSRALHAVVVDKTVSYRPTAECQPHRVCPRCLEPLFLEKESYHHFGTSVIRLQMENAIAGITTKRRDITGKGFNYFNCRNDGSIDWVNQQSLKGAVRFLDLVLHSRMATHPLLTSKEKMEVLPLTSGVKTEINATKVLPAVSESADAFTMESSKVQSTKEKSKDKLKESEKTGNKKDIPKSSEKTASSKNKTKSPDKTGGTNDIPKSPDKVKDTDKKKKK